MRHTEIMIKILPLVVLTATCFAGTGELEVRVRPTAAGPQIHVDGKPVPPRFYFYWAGARSSETNAATLRTVADAGVGTSAVAASDSPRSASHLRHAASVCLS